MSEINWSKYFLRDLPIPGKLPRVDVKSSDERVNGRIFYEPAVHKTLEQLSAHVSQDVGLILLNSKDVVLGTGKSAVLAAEYWKLVDKGETCFWVEVTGVSPMRRILLKVAYEMSASGGGIDILKLKLKAMGGIQQGIYRAPETKLVQRPLTRWMIGALSSQTEDFPIVLANVTTKTKAFSVADAFIFLLELYNRLVSKRIFIFLDQLEIYVRNTNARQIAQEMNELMRGISDKAMLLATMHTDALVKLQDKCGPDVQTFLENAPIIQLPQYSANDLVDIGAFLLSKFRKGKAEPFYPFTSESLGYVARKSDNNIRRFLVRMRAALMLGATSGYPLLDRKFLSSETARSRVFVETLVNE